jgi:hypothetical protein
MYHYGKLPKLLDHIDRNRLNNKIENLRPASYTLNALNRNLAKNNKSGVKGVSNYKNKWRVYFKNEYHGAYEDFDEAIKVRKELEK